MNENVTSLKVYNNIEIVFTNDTKRIKIVGERSDVQNIRFQHTDNVLTISSFNNDLAKERVLVYVPSKKINRYTFTVHQLLTVIKC